MPKPVHYLLCCQTIFSSLASCRPLSLALRPNIPYFFAMPSLAAYCLASSSIFLKPKSDLVTSLLKMLQWCPILLTIKPKSFLQRLWASLCFGPCSPLWPHPLSLQGLCPFYWPHQGTCCSLDLRWHFLPVCLVHALPFAQWFSVGDDIPSRGHLATSEGNFGHDRRELLLASNGWRVGMLLNFMQCMWQPHSEELPAPNVSSAEVRKDYRATRWTLILSHVKHNQPLQPLTSSVTLGMGPNFSVPQFRHL